MVARTCEYASESTPAMTPPSDLETNRINRLVRCKRKDPASPGALQGSSNVLRRSPTESGRWSSSWFHSRVRSSVESSPAERNRAWFLRICLTCSPCAAYQNDCAGNAPALNQSLPPAAREVLPRLRGGVFESLAHVQHGRQRATVVHAHVAQHRDVCFKSIGQAEPDTD